VAAGSWLPLLLVLAVPLLFARRRRAVSLNLCRAQECSS
jgi:hypothetical protein